MWIPPENKDPIQLLAPTRKSVGLFGAVNLRTGQFVSQFEKKFNSVTFEDFLRKLLEHRPRRRCQVVILDNAPYHHGRCLRPFLDKHRGVLKLEFLPPYSPELNPIERVWKLTRKLCTHNQYFPQLEDLINAVWNQMLHWSQPNPVLRKLCGIT
jgi:transposase